MELTLSTGARLRVRPVPTHEIQKLSGQEEAKLGLPPAAPTRALESPLTGATENVPAGEGDPEYDEWIRAMEEWSTQSAEARALINTRLTALTYDYGIVEWCLDYDPRQPEKMRWSSEPPDDWEYAPALRRAGLEPSGNPRLDYIFTELVPRGTDYLAVARAIRAETSPLTNAEVEAQLGGFRPPEQPEEAAEGKRHQPFDVSRRDGSRQRVGLIARLLGKRDAR